jgi:DNA segregation ATPase FtsK/SpoIIIE, S-DNA-T family
MTLVPAESHQGDAESVEVVTAKPGAPVDPPDEHRSVFATITDRKDDSRPPIVPGWMRNPQQRGEVLHWAIGWTCYATGHRLSRSPWYLLQALFWAVVGLVKGTYRLIRWAMAEDGNWSLRQHAVLRNDSQEWRRLDGIRERQATWRWWLIAAGAVALLVGWALLFGLAPVWVRWVVLAACVPVLARIGRPAGRPIIDRITPTARFTKLTADMVRAALCSIGLAAIKDPADITFPNEIHRDGPGYLARANLPGGVVAAQVLERRESLSSALRMPVDQVWPTVGPDHAGQVDLWVGLLPASKMGQPTWSLASPNARTSFFDPAEFGTDQRQRPVRTALNAVNFLIGGVPGSGKSYAGRTLVIAAALDPIVELKIVEFKGTADFGDLEPICSTYACGVDDASIEVGLRVIEWGLAEAERRGERIRRARERGEAPEGKITPELARRPGSGLHPVVIAIDEAHELFGHEEYGKPAASAATRLIKRGRALGITIILMTQIPDKTSLPPSITRCVTVRWCLAVQDQISNDMILGTGAYKRGESATVYRPGIDAGWGLMIGLKERTVVRSHFPTPEVSARIVARARALRGDSVIAGDDPIPTRDVLADVLGIIGAAPGIHWEALAPRLVELDSAAYAGLTQDAISARLRGLGVPSVGVKVDGTNRQGCRRDAVTRVIERRELGTAEDADEGEE